MSGNELNKLEMDVESELQSFLDGVRTMGSATNSFKLFRESYSIFRRKDERYRLLRQYIGQDLLKKTHELKDDIHWLFLFLGVVEGIGNSIVDIVIMLLVANGRDLHIEYRFTTPRIRHVSSMKDLEKEYVPLSTKLNFLRENGIIELSSTIDSDLRNSIAHLDFDVKEGKIYIKEKPARTLASKALLRLLTASNKARTLIEQLAEEKGLNEKQK